MTSFSFQPPRRKSLNLFTDCDHLCHVIHILYLDKIKKEKCSVPPYFMNHVQDTFCDYGQLARLCCDVTGQPEPKITWYKEEETEPLCEYNGKYAVVQNCGHVILLINDVTSNDIGCYTCKVTNTVGEAISTGRLFFSPSKVSTAPQNHLTKVRIEETVKIIEIKTNYVDKSTMTSEPHHHDKSIENVTVQFAMPRNCHTETLSVKSECGGSNNADVSESSNNHLPFCTTDENFEALLFGERSLCSTPVDRIRSPNSTQSTVESVFENEPGNETSGSSCDEDLNKRVQWIQQGESSESDFRRGSVPYPMSLVQVRHASEDTGIYSLPPGFIVDTKKRSRLHSPEYDCSQNVLRFSSDVAPSPRTDKRLKKISGFQSMRNKSFSRSLSSSSSRSSGVAVGSGDLVRAVRAMSQNEYFDKLFQSSQDDTSAAASNDENALCDMLSFQPILRENENEGASDCYENIQQSHNEGLNKLPAKLAEVANTPPSSTLLLQHEVASVVENEKEETCSLSEWQNTKNSDVTATGGLCSDISELSMIRDTGCSSFDQTQSNVKETGTTRSNMADCLRDFSETESLRAFEEACSDLMTDSSSVLSMASCDHVPMRASTNDPERNCLATLKNPLGTCDVERFSRKEPTCHEIISKEKSRFYQPHSLKKICKIVLYSSSENFTNLPGHDTKGSKVIQKLDELIQTLTEFSKKENVVVSSLEIGKICSNSSQRSGQEFYSVNAVRPLKVAIEPISSKMSTEIGESSTGKNAPNKPLAKQQRPHFVIQLQDLTIFDEQPAALNVSVTGNPEPEITWYYNGMHLRQDQVTNEILANGSGVYTCVAKNVAGETTSQATVTVVPRKQPLDGDNDTSKANTCIGNGISDSNIIEPYQTELSLVDYLRVKSRDFLNWGGDMLTLTPVTSQEDGISAADMIDENSKTQNFSSDTKPSLDRRWSILSFSSVSTAAYFSAEEGSFSETTLDYFSPYEDGLMSPDDFFSPDSEHYLSPDKNTLRSSNRHSLRAPTCDEDQLFVPKPAGGAPFVDYYMHNQAENGQTFQITAFNSLQQEASSNDDMETANSGEATPVPHPLVEDDHKSSVSPPSFTEKLQDITAKSTQKVIFSCSVSGSPIPSVSWYKEGVRIALTNRVQKANHKQRLKQNRISPNMESYKGHLKCTLTIDETQASDAGEYTVAASNRCGNILSTAHLKLTLTTAPYFDVILADVRAELGSSSSFSVSVSGSPIPTVTWLKDNEELTSSENVKKFVEGEYHYLRISSVGFNDEGLYSCRASNSAGNAMCKAELVVINPDLSFYQPHDDAIEALTKTVAGARLGELYIFGDVIGKGTRAVVKSLTCAQSDRRFAGKFIRCGKHEKKVVDDEIAILKRSNHSNIAKYHDAFYTSNHAVIIIELCKEELFDFFLCDRTVSESKIAFFMDQLSDALCYIHGRKIVHLDVKPENIMVVNSNQLKLVDFGNAVEIDYDSVVYCDRGIPDFVAPEIVMLRPVTSLTDMWSVGVVTFIALTGISPFAGKTDQSTLLLLRDGRWDFQHQGCNKVSQMGKDFITKLMVMNQDDRMSASSARRHPWLKSRTTDNDQKLSTERLRVFQSARTGQRSLLTDGSRLMTRSISSLLKGEYNLTSLGVPRHVIHYDSFSSSDSDVGNVFDAAKNVTSLDCSDAPLLQEQPHSLPTSPANERRMAFEKSRKNDSLERPLHLNSINLGTCHANVIPRKVSYLLHVCCSESSGFYNEEISGKPPLQPTKRRKQKSFDKTTRLRPKLHNIGKKVSFEDEYNSSPAENEKSYEWLCEADSRPTALTTFDLFAKAHSCRASEMAISKASLLTPLLLTSGPGSPRQRSYDVPLSSSEESADENSTRGEVSDAHSSTRCCIHHRSLSSASPQGSPHYTPSAQGSKKPRKGILKKGGSLDLERISIEEKFKTTPAQQKVDESTEKSSLFQKTPSLEVKNREPVTGLNALSATARRRIQMQRGSSAESCLRPIKTKACGLRGPLAEKRQQQTLDDEALTAGALMRRAPSIKQVTPVGLEEFTTNPLDPCKFKKKSVSVDRPLQKQSSENRNLLFSKQSTSSLSDMSKVKPQAKRRWLNLTFINCFWDMKWIEVESGLRGTSYHANELKRGSTYRFRLTAYNSVSRSCCSQPSEGIKLT
ncbi:uncharacterized protein LOC143468232 isoform X3 [Clavelina lepadiformis]|uniref:uncharacterized protein LOC143468232 isoform X3 n=1 Tax=Clavelina lepadiformis TaxID=159417 RepID=UPI004041441A